MEGAPRVTFFIGGKRLVQKVFRLSVRHRPSILPPTRRLQVCCLVPLLHSYYNRVHLLLITPATAAVDEKLASC